ncbi:MAG: hypothetical protein WBB45_01555 [Cyclobacteriaceae bacterium]
MSDGNSFKYFVTSQLSKIAGEATPGIDTDAYWVEQVIAHAYGQFLYLIEL